MESKQCTRCTRCKETLPITEFSSHPSGRRQAACKLCQRKISGAWYKSNKSHHLKNVSARKRSLREQYIEWKLTLSCSTCTETNPACLDLHHVEDTTKDFNISMEVSNRGLTGMVKELAKCVCLCSNCHRKVHSGDLVLTSNVKRVVVSNEFISR